MSGRQVEAAPVYAAEGNIIDGQVRRDGPGFVEELWKTGP
jgi:hypothetical protein